VPRKHAAWLAAACLAVLLALFIDPTPEPARPKTASSTPAGAGAVPAQDVPASAARADPVLSRARAALQAGRLAQPEGRNALDLFQAVLLAQPDNAEAQAGLARTIDLMLVQASRDAAEGRTREAVRLTRRVLAVAPMHPRALALDRQFNPPDTPSRQLQREQVASAGAPAAIPQDRAAPPAGPAAAPVVTPAPAVRTVAPPAPAPSRAAAADTRPRPDPLAPRYTNAPRPAPARAATARRYGAPINESLPTAGLARAPKPASNDGAQQAVAAGVVAADEFDRVAARNPVYPASALRNRTGGWVELEFTILPNGAVRDVEVVGAEPSGVFDAAASDALADWRFRPRLVNGQPVAQRSRITMRFDVED
jgi:protein TonB